jgi:hypothetical protein
LGRRLDELAYWTEIIGWYAHHPWVLPPLSQRVNLVPSAGQCPTPAAMRIATLVMSQSALTRFSRESKDQVFERGWLTNAYRTDLSNAAEENPIIAKTYEDTLRVSEARNQWISAVRRGYHRDVSQSILTPIRSFVDSRQLNEIYGASAAGAIGSASNQQPLVTSPNLFALPENWRQLRERICRRVWRIAGANGPGENGIGIAIDDAHTLIALTNQVDASGTISAIGPDGTVVVTPMNEFQHPLIRVLRQPPDRVPGLTENPPSIDPDGLVLDEASLTVDSPDPAESVVTDAPADDPTRSVDRFFAQNFVLGQSVIAVSWNGPRITAHTAFIARAWAIAASSSASLSEL